MAVCDNWVHAYAPIIERRRKTPFTEAQRTWQLQCRGRYLEFNLLYDRGVRFGLDAGRFESIMVSAPPLIRWDYNVTPEPASPEEDTLQVLRNPRDWVP
jgi:coproporphyrinogen III oxidase